MPDLFHASEQPEYDALLAAGWMPCVVAGVERWPREIPGGVWTLSWEEAAAEMHNARTKGPDHE